MEKEIRIVVSVSDEEHAELIREELIKTIKNRTTVYFVDRPRNSTFYIENNENKKSAQDEIVEELLLRFMCEPDKILGWVGTMTELYEELWKRLDVLNKDYDRRKFPKSHVALGRLINTIIVNLKFDGIIVEKSRDRRKKGQIERLVRITPEKSQEVKVDKKEEHKEKKLLEKSPEIEVEKKEEHKEEKLLEKSPEIEVEKKEENEENDNWPWPGEDTEDISKRLDGEYVPQEADDKLNMLLQEDEGQKHGVQYLVNICKKKNEKIGGNADNNNKYGDKPSIDNGADHGIVIVPSEDMVVGRIRGEGKKKGKRYKMYAIAVDSFIQDILEDIEHSKDGIIRVKSSDIARKMGKNFIDKKPITIYSGLKYTLFYYNIVVEMGSLKEIDPSTRKSIKILKMRMKNADDALPPSMLRRI